MRILVSGDRRWTDRELVFATLDTWHAMARITMLGEGCSEGAEQMAEEWARSRRIPLAHYPAPWAAMGPKAGAVRNSNALVSFGPHVILAFHDRLEESVTTGDLVTKGKRANVYVVLVTHPREAQSRGDEPRAPSSDSAGEGTWAAGDGGPAAGPEVNGRSE